MNRFTDRLKKGFGDEKRGVRARAVPAAENCRLSPSQMSGLSVRHRHTPSTHQFDVRGDRRILAHDDFVEWLMDRRTDTALIQRSRLVSMQLLTRGHATRVKGVKGRNAGWQRAGLGGSSGSHDYLWYARGGTSLGEQLGLESHEILIRMVRFHDDTDVAISPSDRAEYHDLTSEEILWPGNKADENPFTQEQNDAAMVHTKPIRTIRGFPGAGKTTTLLLSGATGSYSRLLYLTFSKRLAREAREFFDYFTPIGTTIEVLSFEAFLEQLADEVDDSVRLRPPREAAELMVSRLTRNKVHGFFEWENHLDQLYAELHAHAVGSSLPFSFRGMEGTKTLLGDVSAYVENRRTELGSAAESAGTLLNDLSSPQTLFELFPGPCLARSLITDVDQPVPPGFDEFDSVFVDEVQDLTLVELGLVFNFAARIGVSKGIIPSITLAGDESQTVRPTDFAWSDLRSLAREFFPEVDFDDTTLTSNLRSPARIAAIVEATGNQYDLFVRSDRPRGQVQTVIEHEFPGQVTYCNMESRESVQELLAMVEQAPRTCLVYPGSRVPDDLVAIDEQELIWTADEVKGLDYETAIVLDAGERQAELRRRLTSSDDGISVVWGRTLADQYRVCMSRATSKLMLIDRHSNFKDQEPHGSGFALISALVNDEENLPEVVDFDDLGFELSAIVDPIEVIRGITDELPQLLGVNPQRALRRANLGRRRLEEARTLVTVPEELVQKFERLFGVVLVIVAFESSQDSAATKMRIREASEYFARCGLAREFDSFERLMNVLLDTGGRPDLVAEEFVDLRERRQEIKRELGEFVEQFDRSLQIWMNRSWAQPRSDSKSHQTTLGNLRIARDVLAEPLPHIMASFQSRMIDMATTLIGASRYEDSLICLAGLSGPDVSSIRATCFEAKGSYRDAMEAFLDANDRPSAVRAARRAGDLARAQEVDDGSDPSVSNSLAWIERVRDAIGSTTPDLLDEEKRELVRLFDEKIGQTRGKAR